MKKILFFILFSTSIFSQEYPLIENIKSINNKLITSFYNVVEDKSGNIWMSTNEGIFKYDGYSSKEFNKTNGLPSNDIFSLSIDSKGRIWFAGYYNGLYYLENDKIKKIQGTDKYNSLHFFYEENGDLYFRQLGQGVFYVLKNNSLKLEEIDYVCKYHNKKILYKDKKFFVEDKEVLIDFEFQYVYNSNIWPNDFIFQKLKEPKGPFNHILDRTIPNQYYEVSNNKKVIKYFVPKWGDVQIQYIPVVINYSLTIFKYNNEIKVFDNKVFSEEKTIKIRKIINDLKVDFDEITRIYIDSKGKAWVLLKNYKLYVVPNDYDKIVEFDLSENFGRINICNENPNSNNIVLHNDKILNLYDENLKVLNSYALDFDCKNIYSYDGSVYLFGEQKAIKSSLRNFKPEILNIYYYIKASVFKNKKIVCLFRDNAYCVLSDSTFKFNEKIRLNAVDFSNRYLFTTNEDGVYRYEKATKNVIKNKSIKGSVTISLVKDKILLGTNGSGLLILDENLKIEKSFLKNENIFFISQSNENDFVYISSTSGNYTLELDEKITLQKLNLFKNKIDNVFYTKDFICFIIDGKLIRINKKFLETEKIDNLNVVDIVSNKKKFNKNSDEITLEPNEFTLEMNFLSDESYKNVLFYKNYKIFDLNQNKIIAAGKIENNKLFIPDVETGEYEIIIEVFDHYHNCFLTKKIKVVKEPPFYKTTAFKIIFLLLLINIMIMTVFFSDLVIKSKFKKRIDIIDLEQKMLVKQMNPHYLFNALYNLQCILFLKEESDVNIYLTKFSKLLRSTMELTSKKSNLIIKEIEYIENYISFENEKHNLSIQLIVENKTDLNLSGNEIPSMLIQPIIENAIIHGFLSSKEEFKTIKIEVLDYTEKSLLLSITDNGVGRKVNKYKTDSIALVNIKKRLEIFSKILKSKYFIEIVDLKDESDSPIGTKVNLKIPIL